VFFKDSLDDLPRLQETEGLAPIDVDLIVRRGEELRLETLNALVESAVYVALEIGEQGSSPFRSGDEGIKSGGV
jgi:hypothetical protein